MLRRVHPEHRITNYIEVSSVDEYSARVLELGGKVIVPKRAVPAMGKRCSSSLSIDRTLPSNYLTQVENAFSGYISI